MRTHAAAYRGDPYRRSSGAQRSGPIVAPCTLAECEHLASGPRRDLGRTTYLIGECPTCGGRLVYDPGSAGLACTSCEAKVAFTRTPGEVSRVAFDPAAADPGRTEIAVAECASCGAAMQLSSNVVAGRCPYCKTPFVDERRSTQAIPPHGIVPLQITAEQAGSSFRDWAGHSWFAPKDFRKQAANPDLVSNFFPVWTFDLVTSTAYRGERGEDVTTWQTVTSTNADGSSSTSQVATTTIVWHKTDGQVNNRFADVVASGGWPLETNMESLSPWKLDQVVSYQDEYLLGSVARTYTVDVAGGLGEAKTAVAPAIERAVKDDIGGNHQRIDNLESSYSGVTFRHLLLPLWAGAYQSGGKVFPVLVNGQSGKVVGQRPYSAIKVALTVALAVLIVIALILLLSR